MTESSINISAGEVLSELKKSRRMTIAQKMQLAQLQIDAERLEIDKVKTRTEQKFWNKNFAVTVTTIVSFAAVLISFAQVWNNYVQKERELAVKDKELEIIQIKNGKDFDINRIQLSEQQKSAAVRVISDFKEMLINGDKRKIEAFEKFIRVNFPSVNTEDFFSAFEITTTSSETGQEIQTIRALIIPKTRTNSDFEAEHKLGQEKNTIFNLIDPQTKIIEAENSPKLLSAENISLIPENKAVVTIPKKKTLADILASFGGTLPKNYKIVYFDGEPVLSFDDGTYGCVVF